MTPSAGLSQVVSALEHYERCIAEGNDPCKDGALMQRYMARWDGPKFFEMLGDLAGKDVLEVGVGTGRLARQVLGQGCSHFTGIDLSPKTIDRARCNLRGFHAVDLFVADITTFDRHDAYDRVYSVLTLMHIADKATALTAMVAALRPGGAIVLSIDRTGPWLDFGNRRVRLYPAAPEAYAERLAELGCEVDEPVPLIDAWIDSSGSRGATYGSPMATLLRATKP